MKAPDKIYIQDYNIPEYGLSTTWTTEKVENDAVRSIEYIRKEALLEWLEQNRNQAQMWFDRYNDREDLSAKQVWEEVIGKLNSM